MYTTEQYKQLKAERDALAMQVDMFRNAFELIWQSDDRAAWDGKAVQHFDELITLPDLSAEQIIQKHDAVVIEPYKKDAEQGKQRIGYIDERGSYCGDTTDAPFDVFTYPQKNGWKLVPVDPTKAMCEAYWYQYGRDHFSLGCAWKAMLEAAPTPEEKP